MATAGSGPSVGLVGAGEMGMLLAQRLIESAVPVIAHARRSEVLARLREIGAVPVTSLSAASTGAEVVIVCVRSDAQVLEVVTSEGGLAETMEPGSVLVIHTTGRPDTAEAISKRMDMRGIAVLDAPFSGSPDDLRSGEITLLVGGDDGVLESVRPVLRLYGGPVLRLGPVGSGQRVKLLNNLLLSANVAAILELERIAADLQVDVDQMLPVLLRCSSRSFAMEALAANRTREVSVARLLGLLSKDVETVLDVARGLRIDLGDVGAMATRLMRSD